MIPYNMDGQKILDELTQERLNNFSMKKKFFDGKRNKEAINGLKSFESQKINSIREKIPQHHDIDKPVQFHNSWKTNCVGMRWETKELLEKQRNSFTQCRCDKLLKEDEHEVGEYENIKKSLSRITKTQERIKGEMKETKRILNKKIDKIDKTYQSMTSDVRELSHLIELARFVNNRIERINIRERLESHIAETNT